MFRGKLKFFSLYGIFFWGVEMHYNTWARGFLCLLFLPPLLWEKCEIRIDIAAMTFENLISFHLFQQVLQEGFCAEPAEI